MTDAHGQHEPNLAEAKDFGEGGQIECLAVDLLCERRTGGRMARDGQPQQPAGGDEASIDNPRPAPTSVKVVVVG